MNKVTREKNRDFTTISNVFLRDKNLSLKSKGFLAVIMGLPDDWDFSINGICSILREGKTSVYSTIKELVQYRYCNVVQQRKADGTIAGTDYSFFEIPYDEVPQQDYPYSENPNMDNQPQLNTNSNKVKKETKKDLKENIDKRRQIFLNDLGLRFSVIYPGDMLDRFADYWTEPNKSGTKMRFEMEKTWDLGRRLKRWSDNDNKFRNGQANNSTSNDKQQRMQGYAKTLNDMLTEVERNRANGKFGQGSDDDKLCW